MKRRGFLKSMMLTPLIGVLPVLKLSAKEPVSKITYLYSYPTSLPKGIFTGEELAEAGFVPVVRPVFKDNGIVYTLKSYKLKVKGFQELEQDLKAFHNIDFRQEIKAVLLDELKKIRTGEFGNKRVKYIMNVYEVPITLDPITFCSNKGYYVRMATV